MRNQNVFKVQDGQLPGHTSNPVGWPFPDLVPIPSTATATAKHPGIQVGK